MSTDIRIHKRSSYEDCTIVPNPTAQNPNLSWAARGLLLYCLSLPVGWQIREEDLVGRSPAGRDHLRAIVRELEAAGHVRRTRHRQTNGLLGPSEWEVWDMPQEAPLAPPSIPQKPRRRAPRTGKPSMVAPRTGKPSLENPSVDRTLAATGVSPRTENPSMVAEPQTENPSVDKTLSTTAISPPAHPQTENPSVAVLYHPTTDGKSHHIERTTGRNKPSIPVSKGGPGGFQPDPQPAPVATTTGRGTIQPSTEPTTPASRRRSFSPKLADVPLDLQPLADEILDFWSGKQGARSDAAWRRLLTELRKIRDDRQGGVAVVQAQLLAGIQAGWHSVTHDNWRRYGLKPKTRPAEDHPYLQHLHGARPTRGEVAVANITRLLETGEHWLANPQS